MKAKTPEDVDRLFAEYINAGNVAGVASLYEADGVLINPESEARGHAAIAAALQPLVEAKLVLQMNVTKIARSGDTALIYNDWSGTVTGPEGPQAIRGKAIEVVRRQADGSWLMLIDEPYARG